MRINATVRDRRRHRQDAAERLVRRVEMLKG
jgi:hypothetical protein